MKPWSKILKEERGQAMVEIALVLPILLLLLFGCVEFGRVFGASLLINNLARDAVRYGVVGCSDAEIESSITSNLVWLDAGNLAVTIDPTEGSRVKGEPLAVTIDYDVELVAPVIANVLPNPVPLSARYVMRVE